LVSDAALTLSPEHDAYQWVTAVEAAHLLSATDASTSWARRLIARAEAIAALLPPDLRALNRTQGFELS
jgi:hypothetical protein